MHCMAAVCLECLLGILAGRGSRQLQEGPDGCLTLETAGGGGGGDCYGKGRSWRSPWCYGQLDDFAACFAALPCPLPHHRRCIRAQECTTPSSRSHWPSSHSRSRWSRWFMLLQRPRCCQRFICDSPSSMCPLYACYAPSCVGSSPSSPVLHGAAPRRPRVPFHMPLQPGVGWHKRFLRKVRKAPKTITYPRGW